MSEIDTTEIIDDKTEASANEQVRNNRIFCYTGTGNSFAASKVFAKVFDCSVEFIVDELLENTEVITADRLIVVVPSYAYGVPKLVKKWLKAANFDANYFAVIVTYGSKPRGTAAEAIKILRKKGVKVNFSGGTIAVENYVHLFGHPSEKMKIERTAAQERGVAALVTSLEEKEENTVRLARPFSAFVSGLFRSIAAKFVSSYKIMDTCNGCGICRRVCPPDVIEMVERVRKGKKWKKIKDEDKQNPEIEIRTIPKFKGKKCDHCQACMQLCPKKSIKYFRIKPDSPRYLHKDVKMPELLKRE